MRKYARKALYIVIILLYVSMAFGEDNTNIQATIDQAKKYINENKPDEAIKVLDKIIDSRCSNAEACFLKGKSLCMLERDSDALKFYEGALSTDRNYADAQKGKCEALCNLSRDAEFRQCTDELAKIGSFKTAADNIINIKCPFRTSGNISQESYIYKQALDLYNRSIAENKNNTGAWNNKGVALGMLRRYNESIACFDQAIIINSTFAEAWNNRGVSLDKMNKHKEALESFNKSILINPILAVAWFNKANTMFELNKIEQARYFYLNATDLDSMLESMSEFPNWIYIKS